MIGGISSNGLKLFWLRLCWAVGLFRVTRWLARRKLLILCYHGFSLDDESGFRPRLFMDADVFRRRLELIRRSGSPVLPLEEAVHRLREGTLPDNAVCLTIDDGFYSTLVHAAPALRAQGYDATLYVTSYYVEKNAPIFRLVVQYMFWKTQARTLDTCDYAWGASLPIDLSREDERHRSMWHIIHSGEHDYDEPGRQRISTVLGNRLGVPYDGIVASRILTLLTPEEIRAVQAMGVDVQLHTHRHNLSADDEASVRREIMDNRKALERILDRPVRHFCYPSGAWDRCQWPWLRALGVHTATTCNPSLNTSSTPSLGLYRIVDANDVEEIEFEAELYGFSELIRQLTARRKAYDAVRQEEIGTAQQN